MKIVIVGQANYDNMGDILMFALYIKALNERKHTVSIYGAHPIVRKRLHDEGLSFNNVDCNFEKKVADLCVFIGGGYFGQPGLTWPIWQINFLKQGYFYNVVKNCQNKKIPYVINGVEIGPLSGPFIRKSIRTILKNAQYVIVRNDESKKFMQDTYNLESLKFSDVVLGNVEKYMNIFSENPLYNIGIHLTEKILRKNIFSEHLKLQIYKLIKKTDTKSVILFSDRALSSDDSNTAHEIRNTIHNFSNSIDCEFYNFDHISWLLSIISRTKLLITTKLHCGIISYGYGNIAICVGSHPKIKRFYKDIGMDRAYFNYYWPFIDIIDFYKSLENIHDCAKHTIAKRKTESANNINFLLNYLEQV